MWPPPPVMGRRQGPKGSETVLGRCCHAARCAIGQCAVRVEDVEVLFIRDVVGVDLRRQVVGDVVTGHQVVGSPHSLE